jgi:hypothetical protein
MLVRSPEPDLEMDVVAMVLATDVTGSSRGYRMHTTNQTFLSPGGRLGRYIWHRIKLSHV